MDELREYMYVTNGVPTTAMLTEAHAAQLGATLVAGQGEPDVKRGVPANKARTPDDKGA